MRLLAWLGKGLAGLCGLLVPVGSRARAWRGLSPPWRWLLHLACVAAVLAGLGWLNYQFDLERFLRAPLPWLRKVWLPLLFFFVYLNLWLGWWLWQLLGPDQETSAYPDLDAAWAEAVRAVERAGLEVTRVPLFVVLGRPEAPEEALFQASRLEWAVAPAPRRPDAPLHVYANSEAIFVTCPGASLLARHAALLTGGADPGPNGQGEAAPADLTARGADRAGAPPGTSQPRPRLGRAGQAREPGPSPGARADAEQRALGLLFAEEEAERARQRAERRPFLLTNVDEAERLTARLRHLCRRITRARRPYCPVNGVLVLLPFAASDSDTAANQTGAVCQHELTVVREELRVHCPVVVLVCDGERVPGFCELVQRFPEDRRDRHLGKQFPHLTELDAAALPEMIAGAVRWLCEALVPALVYRLLRPADPDGAERPDGVAGNVRLYHFLCQMRQRQERLCRLVLRGVAPGEKTGPVVQGAFPLRGCFLAGTGRDAAREQAFVAGVFHQLLKNQNVVSWTADALAEEADYKRWTRCGYLALGLFTLALLALGCFW
jgi:hypothetical protein